MKLIRVKGEDVDYRDADGRGYVKQTALAGDDLVGGTCCSGRHRVYDEWRISDGDGVYYDVDGQGLWYHARCVEVSDDRSFGYEIMGELEAKEKFGVYAVSREDVLSALGYPAYDDPRVLRLVPRLGDISYEVCERLMQDFKYKTIVDEVIQELLAEGGK